MLRLPDNSQHIAIVGSNGSGKTRAATWHLSKRNYNTVPWIVLDFKRDDLLARVPGEEIDITEKLPTHPGIYFMRPDPRQQDELADMLIRMWIRERIGLFIDEGYMVESPEANNSLRLIYTQGRSKRIPTMTLSQRPVWINRFALSEATFYQLFRLNDARDRKTVQQFMPDSASSSLPPFHSWYYDSGNNALNIMSPVPSDDEILSGFQLAPKKRKLFFT